MVDSERLEREGFPDVCLALCLFLESGRCGEILGWDIRLILDDVVFTYDIPNPSLHNETGDLERVESKVYSVFSGPIVGPHCLYAYRFGNVPFIYISLKCTG